MSSHPGVLCQGDCGWPQTLDPRALCRMTRPRQTARLQRGTAHGVHACHLVGCQLRVQSHSGVAQAYGWWQPHDGWRQLWMDFLAAEPMAWLQQHSMLLSASKP